MFSIIGILVVFGCVIAGYTMEHGKLAVLIQPAELIIIGGAAIGVLAANPMHVLKKMMAGFLGVSKARHTPRSATPRPSRCSSTSSPKRAKRRGRH